MANDGPSDVGIRTSDLEGSIVDPIVRTPGGPGAE